MALCVGTPREYNQLVSNESVYIFMSFEEDSEGKHYVAALYCCLDDAFQSMCNDYGSPIYGFDGIVYHSFIDHGPLCITPAAPLTVEDLGSVYGDDTSTFDWEARTRDGALWYRVLARSIFGGPTPNIESLPGSGPGVSVAGAAPLPA